MSTVWTLVLTVCNLNMCTTQEITRFPTYEKCTKSKIWHEAFPVDAQGFFHKIKYKCRIKGGTDT